MTPKPEDDRYIQFVADHLASGTGKILDEWPEELKQRCREFLVLMDPVSVQQEKAGQECLGDAVCQHGTGPRAIGRSGIVLRTRPLRRGERDRPWRYGTGPSRVRS